MHRECGRLIAIIIIDDTTGYPPARRSAFFLKSEIGVDIDPKGFGGEVSGGRV